MKPTFITAPKTIQQRFASQAGKFNHWYGDLPDGERYTLTFDRAVENRVNLHAGSPDTEAVASVLYSETVADNANGFVGWWRTNDGQLHKTLHDAAEHMISNRAEPRGDADSDVQGHPSADPFDLENDRLDALADEFMAGKEVDLKKVDYSEVEKRVMARLAAEGREGRVVVVGDAGQARSSLDALMPAIGAHNYYPRSYGRPSYQRPPVEHVQGPGRPAANGQHKGSKSAKGAARSAQKLAKASKRARRAKRQEKTNG